ncbi:hypothetical protein F5B22DRAFT_588486 [Xylaria bambusicola]|uniref:uncharacterized protein n=1 Tax=Xylaria bambusicola TaxID=326684 RepID=UPI00200731C4|nr:uncharacterized protein F5B22DRAFT_588486 [Xylaria bambusicola]KAI0525960.1 hypothetical protein F5B22DRAFT_588486 [Xylaria bambusicola]
MVLCSFHLFALKEGHTPPTFLSALHKAGIKPIVQALVLRWMILPQVISTGHLLARNVRWDMLLVLPEGSHISESLRASAIAAEWTASIGTSSKLLSSYSSLNAELLNPVPGTVPPASLDLAAAAQAESSQNLELTPELASFIAALPAHIKTRPVSMLNLLSLNEGKHAQYVKYGHEFSSRVGARYGGRVKIVGKVTSSGVVEPKEGDVRKQQQEGWDEIAFVHYPSITHFASMAADNDYQGVNHKYRLGALKDTFIICVVEISPDGKLVCEAEKENKMKL